MKHDIFVSYSRCDLESVRPIKEELEAAGFSCWMDLDGIESGEANFVGKIVPALDGCKAVLFFISTDSQKSKWTIRELNYAENHEKRVVLVRFNDDPLTGAVELVFGLSNIIDWRKFEQREKLVCDLRRWLGPGQDSIAVQPGPASLPPTIPPPLPRPPGSPRTLMSSVGRVGRYLFGRIGKQPVFTAAAIAVLSFCAIVAALFLSSMAENDEPVPDSPPASTRKAGPAEKQRRPSSLSPQESAATESSDFARDVAIDDVYRTERQPPASAPAPEWDEEDRFIARRDAASQLRAFAEWLAEGTNGLIRPVADADGVVRIGPGEIVATADVLALQGIRKVLLDGGELLFSRTMAELARFHAEAMDVAIRAEAGTAADDEVRDWPAERMARRLSESDAVFPLPIEIGPGGGWITCRRTRNQSESSESVVSGDVFPGPAGAGRAVAAGIRFSAKGFERAPSLSGSYSVWTSPDSSNNRAHPLHCHNGWLTGVQRPPSWRRVIPSRSSIEALNGHCRTISGILGESIDYVPDENGDIVVPRNKTLLVGDVQDGGAVQRIVLRGGKIAFGPSRAEMRETLDRLSAIVSTAQRSSDVPPDEELFAPPTPVQSLSVPVLVGKEGGTISCESSFVEEARLLSRVLNEFGERPEMRIVGGVLVDPTSFSRKIGMQGRDLVASLDEGKPISQSTQSDETFWLCDFSGPFPRRLSRAELYASDRSALSSALSSALPAPSALSVSEPVGSVREASADARRKEGENMEKESAFRQSPSATPMPSAAGKSPEPLVPPDGIDSGDRWIAAVSGVSVPLHWCQPGTFLMGSPVSENDRGNDETQHRVTLTKGFWMGETEVTEELWDAVMSENLASFRSSGETYPVTNISWNKCQDFMEKLNAQTPVAGFLWALPTEAQWEYACRAGTEGAYGGTGRLDDMGWFSDNSLSRMWPVGRKEPNAWGLFDMHGNVPEWCADRYGPYPEGSVTNSEGPSSGVDRVCRGGCWNGRASSCRSSFREFAPPVRLLSNSSGMSFRIALVPVQ